ncbi:MAG: hypothetical protein EHM19_05465 [Candidatus Latescibacterota bacterium]|nr:MAG: hypothetical protein EHM19_05465 [Candidatus Latescibacterota bacterium]
MKKLLLVGLLALAVVASAFADVPNRPMTAANEAIAPYGTGGATGFCSIVYYNLCSGWLWTYSGFAAGDEPGVAFDMPTDCGKLAGETCVNNVFWWYWRYTTPGWGYTITYKMYNLDAQLCKLGAPVGVLAAQDPTERWNTGSVPGVATTDWLALTATYDKGGLPRFATDNNNASVAAPVACPGWVIGPLHTLYWGGTLTQYCPPQYFADGIGAVDALMDAGFTCSPTAVEDASWTGVKSLFR